MGKLLHGFLGKVQLNVKLFHSFLQILQLFFCNLTEFFLCQGKVHPPAPFSVK